MFPCLRPQLKATRGLKSQGRGEDGHAARYSYVKDDIYDILCFDIVDIDGAFFAFQF